MRETVTVKPLTQWAKNKVTQHGDTFEVMERRFCRWGNIRVRSLNKTWRSGGVDYYWAGWFNVGVDVDVEVVPK